MFIFGLCKWLDIELEMGVIVGIGLCLGKLVLVVEVDEMIFGYVLLNDWFVCDI